MSRQGPDARYHPNYELRGVSQTIFRNRLNTQRTRRSPETCFLPLTVGIDFIHSRMKILSAVLLAVAMALVGIAGGPETDHPSVDGNWLPVQAELGGQSMPDAVLKSISLKLENGRYEVFVGPIADRGTCTVDSSAKPKGMTITGTDGPNKGKTFPAIYEFNGEKLRICYDLSGAKRPTEFKTVPGTQLYLVTYTRKTN